MTNPARFDALVASAAAYADAIKAGFLPLASSVTYDLYNVDHDTFLRAADHYGATIRIRTGDEHAYPFVRITVPLYADPDTFTAGLTMYSGSSLAHLPQCDPAFLTQCETHNRECVTTDAPDYDHVRDINYRALKPSILNDPNRIGAAGSEFPPRGDGVREVNAHRPEHGAIA